MQLWGSRHLRAPANYFCWLSFFKASLWSTSAPQQSWRLSGTPGQAWEQLREILKTPFRPHGNPGNCPSVGLSESPMLHCYGTRSLPNAISLQEEERGHATWKAEGTWYRILNNVSEPRLHKPSTSAAMCLLWLWGEPTLVLALLFHSCCFLHSSRCLPPQIECVLLFLTTYSVSPHSSKTSLRSAPDQTSTFYPALTVHTLQQRESHTPQLSPAPKEESEIGCKQRLE